MIKYIPVVVKKPRVVNKAPNDNATLNFHTYKCFAAVLAVNNGRYVRKMVGQDERTVQWSLLLAIAAQNWPGVN